MALSSSGAKNRIWIALLLLGVLVLGMLGLIFGSANIGLQDVLAVLFRQDTQSKNAIIIWSVRLPRVIGGLLAGVGLGTAGVILQFVMNNSLASPNTIGVNSGAGFFVMLAMVFAPQNLFAKSLMSFVGALVTTLLILCLAMLAEKSRITIVLAGITISSFLSAGMNMIKILDSDITINATQFLIGSLAGVTMKMIQIPAIGIAIGIFASIVLAKGLNILALGDGIAGSLGLPVNYYRFLFVVIASVLAGFVVSYAGLIGFVGLIVPHVARFLFGQDARILIPTSALLGAIFVLASDLICRTMFAPFEIPVGIVLSLAGGPFFLYLLMKKGGRRVNA